MRKILLYLILIISIFGAIIIVTKGIYSENIEIDSYLAIAEENQELDDLIKEANNQKEVNYQKQEESLKNAYKSLNSEKESYQELLELGVDKDGIPLSRIQEYEIEKIWISIGGYAEKEGVDLKIDISVNNADLKTYDLNFTVTGMYSSIEDFIRDIQSDNTLVFKIENFKLVSANAEDMLTATFVCKEIKINIANENTDDTSDSSNTVETNKTSTESTKDTKK